MLQLKNNRGVVLILTIATLLVILLLVLGVLFAITVRHKKAISELEATQALLLAESAIDQQLLFLDRQNWNIDWDDDGVLNNLDGDEEDGDNVPGDLATLGLGINDADFWQNYGGVSFPSIRWKTGPVSSSFAGATNPQYTGGTHSTLYNFAKNLNHYADSRNNWQYRAVFELDTTDGTDNPYRGLEISYMGRITGKGAIRTQSRTTHRIVQSWPKILPEAFNHHVIYTGSLSDPGNITRPNNDHIYKYGQLSDSYDSITNTTNTRRSGPLPVPDEYINITAPANITRFPLNIVTQFGNGSGTPPDINISGITLGGVIYIDDNATIGDNTNPTIINGTLIVNGTLDIQGMVTIRPASTFLDYGVDGLPQAITGTADTGEGNDSYDAGEPIRIYPAIVCNDDITISGSNNYITGLIYGRNVAGDATISTAVNGTATIYGTIVADIVSFSNAGSNITITWNPAVFNNPPPFFIDEADLFNNNLVGIGTPPSLRDLRVFRDNTRWQVFQR